MTKIEEEKIRKIFIFRVRGRSLESIGKVFHFTRERIRQILNENKDKPEFKKLYLEIQKTQKFLERELK